MRQKILTEGPLWRKRILLATAFMVPLLFLRDLNDPINVPKLGLLMVAVVLAGSIRVAEILQGADREGLKPLLLPAVAVALPLAIGWGFSPYRVWALFGHYPRFMGLLPYLIIVGFGILLADAFAGDPEPVAWSLVSAAGVAGGYALLQVAGLDPFEWEAGGLEATGAVSTLGNPNFAGGFLAIALPVAVGLLARRSDLRSRSVPLFLLTLGGWLAAASEGAWLAGVAGVAVTMTFLLGTEKPWVRWLGFAAAGLAAFIAVGAVLWAFDEERAASLPSTVERRAEWWSAAGSMAKESPLVGRGPNSFAIEHSRYRTVEDAKVAGLSLTDDPHSVFLSYVTAAGILGGLGFLVLMGSLFRMGMSSDGSAWTWAFFGAVVAYAVQALVSVDTVALRTALWVSAAGMTVSLGAGARRRESRPSSRNRKKRTEPIQQLPAMALVPVVAALALWWSFGFVLADGRFQSGITAIGEGQLEPAQQSFEAAIDHRGEIAYRRSYGTTLGTIGPRLQDDGASFIEDAEDSFSFIERVPHVPSIRALALVLRDWAAIEPAAEAKSLELYERAISLDPLDPELLNEAALAAVTFGEHDRAVEMLESKTSRIDDPRTWGALALAEVNAGGVDAAQAAAERALALDPAQISALQALELIEDQNRPSS